VATETPRIALTRVPRLKLAESVAQQLLEAVRGLPPGTRVPSERELTKELGVGRSTVREALNGLALLGVVEVRHGQGVFVVGDVEESESGLLEAALERGVTKEFVEARLVVEVEVARMAAERRTDEDVRLLEAVLEEQERRLSGDVEPLLDTAANFNVVLAECAHNEVLVAIIQSFVALMLDERGPKIYSLDGFREWDLAEHRGLFEAVRDHDGALAAERMRDHILVLADRYRDAGAA
jgi:DNA-binding FadR family transcriptional regulator